MSPTHPEEMSLLSRKNHSADRRRRDHANERRGALVPAIVAVGLLALAACSDVTRVYELMFDIGELDQLADGSGREQVTLKQGIAVPSQVSLKPMPTRPLPPLPMPDHPFMLDERDSAGVHADTYNSSVSHQPGPTGTKPIAYAPEAVATGKLGMCTPMLRDRKDRLASVCIALDGPSQLLLFDSDDRFKILARADVPARSGLLDPAGGWYSRMDHLGRVVVPTPAQDIRVYSVDESDPQNLQWKVDERWDLSEHLREDMSPNDVVLDWQGNFWFITGYGQLGHIDRKSGETQVVEMGAAPGEESTETIGTALSVTEEAAFVHTSKAIYRMELDDRGRITRVWRWEFGESDTDDLTAPTLFDGGKLMAIGLNGTPESPDRGLLVVLKTAAELPEGEDRSVCRLPVFKSGSSQLRNTMVGYNRTVLVQNNAHGKFFELHDFVPGNARVDVLADHSGCELVWENYQVASQTPPRLSTADAVLYQYSRRRGIGDDVHAWYLSASDFDTGELIRELFVGSGKRLDNPMLSIDFMPGGKLVSGIRNGIVTLEDSE